VRGVGKGSVIGPPSSATSAARPPSGGVRAPPVCVVRQSGPPLCRRLGLRRRVAGAGSRNRRSTAGGHRVSETRRPGEAVGARTRCARLWATSRLALGLALAGTPRTPSRRPAAAHHPLYRGVRSGRRGRRRLAPDRRTVPGSLRRGERRSVRGGLEPSAGSGIEVSPGRSPGDT